MSQKQRQLPAVLSGKWVHLQKFLHGRMEHVKSGGQPPDPDVDADSLILERACDVVIRPTRWLWPGRIPMGRLTLLAGDDSAGTSLVAMDIAARVSREAAWPDAPPPTEQVLEAGVANAPADFGELSRTEAGTPTTAPAGKRSTRVIVCTARDELAETVAPRLLRAGADMRRVRCLDGAWRGRPDWRSRWTRDVRLPEDFGSLRAAVRELPDVRLLILDPIEPFFASTLGRSESYMEQAADALRAIALQMDVAIIGVTELRRGGGRGLIPAARPKALTSLARAAWGIVRYPQSPGRSLMVPLKVLVDGEGPPLEFTCRDGRINWKEGAAALTTEDLPRAERMGAKAATAAAWLLNLLAGGGRLACEIQQLARESGISRTLLRTVTAELGIRMERIGYQGKSRWALPDTDTKQSCGTDSSQAELGNEESEETESGIDDPRDGNEGNGEKARTYGNCPARMEESGEILIRAGVEETPRV